MFPDTSIRVVASSEWYRQRFSVSGDWDSWIWDTVLGRDYSTRQPFFRGYVVCANPLGRANAEIARLALRNGKAVLYWSRNEPLRVVQEVVTRDPESWTDGWTVRCGSIQQGNP